MNPFIRFSEFKSKDLLVDVEFKTKSGSIKAHKLILASQSDYFYTLIQNSNLSQSFNNIVDLSQFDHDHVEYVINFVYKSIPQICNISNKEDNIVFLIEILKIADYLVITDIISQIDVAFSSHPSNFNIINIFNSISKESLKSTYIQCLRRFQECIKNQKELENYLLITPHILINFLRDTRFSAREWKICRFILDYLNCHVDTIQEFNSAKDLIHTIDINRLDSYYLNLLTNFMSKFNETTESFKKSYDRNENFLLFLNRKGTETSYRAYSLDYEALDGWNVRLSDYHSLRFLISKTGFVCLNSEWISFSENDLIISMELCEMSSTLHSSTKYNNPTPQLFGMSQENVNLSNFLIIPDQLNNLYLIGGQLSKKSGSINIMIDSILKYGNNVWKIMDNVKLKSPCCSLNALIDCDDNLWVLGGKSSRAYLKQFYKIHLPTGRIENYPDLPRTISNYRVELINDNQIFVVYSPNLDNNSILIFDQSQTNSGWISVDYKTEYLGFKCFYQYSKLNFIEFINILYDDETGDYMWEKQLVTHQPPTLESDIVEKSQPVRIDNFHSSISEVWCGRWIMDSIK